MLIGMGAGGHFNFGHPPGAKGLKASLRDMGRQANALVSPKLPTIRGNSVEDCMLTAIIC